jgi:hypothetical protein
VCVGLQAVKKETLKLFNRKEQTKQMFKKVIDRLGSFDIPTKIDVIIGNPVQNPVDDAIETIKFVQSLEGNVIVTVFPLMLYPGTRLAEWCVENKIALNDECNFNWYSGVGSIKFEPDTNKKIRNLTKLGHFFVTHKVSEGWIRALIEADINDDAAHCIARRNYFDSLVHHGKTKEEAEKIVERVKLYF